MFLDENSHFGFNILGKVFFLFGCNFGPQILLILDKVFNCVICHKLCKLVYAIAINWAQFATDRIQTVLVDVPLDFGVNSAI